MCHLERLLLLPKTLKCLSDSHYLYIHDKNTFLNQMSFPEDALRENVGAFMNALLLAKPAGLKKSNKLHTPSLHFCMDIFVLMI